MTSAPGCWIRIGAILLCLPIASGCARTDPAWEEAVRTDTPDAYSNYLQEHPKGIYAEQARIRRDALVDERDWNAARRADFVAAYTQYLSSHPDGVWSELAVRRRDALTVAAVEEPAVEEPAVEEPAVEEPAVPSTGVVVQLGAFSSSRSAGEGWTKLQRSFVELQERSPIIDVEPVPGASLYRLRLKCVDAEDAARVCAALIRGGAECIKPG